MPKNTEKSVNLLKFVYVVVPIVAGLDKFFNVLVDWTSYVSSVFGGMDPVVVLTIVGIIEIIAGLIVLFKTKIGSYIVSAWLVLIAINLIIAGFYDIAVRDLAMSAGAYALALLSE